LVPKKIGAESPIPNPIKLAMIEIDAPSYSDIDWVATTTAQTGVVTPNRETIESVQSKYSGITNNIEVTEVNGKKSYSYIKRKMVYF